MSLVACALVAATLMDGKALAARVKEEVKRDVAELGSLGLATILVGEDPASEVYVRLKHTDALEVGIRSIDKRLPAETTQEEVLALIEELNADDEVDGFLVQTPLPGHLDESALLAAVRPGEGRRRADAAQRRPALPRPQRACRRDAARRDGSS